MTASNPTPPIPALDRRPATATAPTDRRAVVSTGRGERPVRGASSMVEHWPFKPVAVGSSPTRLTLAAVGPRPRAERHRPEAVGSAFDGPGAGRAGLAREGPLAEHADEAAPPRCARAKRALRQRSLARAGRQTPQAAAARRPLPQRPTPPTSSRAEADEQSTASAGRGPERDSLPPAAAAGRKGAPNRRPSAPPPHPPACASRASRPRPCR